LPSSSPRTCCAPATAQLDMRTRRRKSSAEKPRSRKNEGSARAGDTLSIGANQWRSRNGRGTRPAEPQARSPDGSRARWRPRSRSPVAPARALRNGRHTGLLDAAHPVGVAHATEGEVRGRAAEMLAQHNLPMRTRTREARRAWVRRARERALTHDSFSANSATRSRARCRRSMASRSSRPRLRSTPSRCTCASVAPALSVDRRSAYLPLETGAHVNHTRIQRGGGQTAAAAASGDRAREWRTRLACRGGRPGQPCPRPARRRSCSRGPSTRAVGDEPSGARAAPEGRRAPPWPPAALGCAPAARSAGSCAARASHGAAMAAAPPAAPGSRQTRGLGGLRHE
jgi:hypothetical protein